MRRIDPPFCSGRTDDVTITVERRLDSGRPRIKVLIVIPTLGLGGAEMDIVRNIPLLDRDRFDIVVCTYLKRGALADELTRQGIEVVGPLISSYDFYRRMRAAMRRFASYVRARAPGWPAWAKRLTKTAWTAAAPVFRGLAMVSGRLLNIVVYLVLAYRLARLLHRSHIDVVHTVLPSSYIVATLAKCFGTRRPLIMSRLSLNWYHQSDRLFAIIERFFHRFVDCAVGNSQSIIDELAREGIARSKLVLVRNGIDVTAFRRQMIERRAARRLLGLNPNALAISCVANLFEYKGHADLLHAAHRLRNRIAQDWIILVVGRDEGTLQTLERLALDLGLLHHVRFLGERRDIPVILSAADIHVSASWTEGLPNNVLEAMSAGLAVVATAVGGVPEIVDDGITGLLAPARNPALLANAIRLLASDPTRRSEMGAAALARVQSSFSVERSVTALSAAYAGLATGGLRMPTAAADMDLDHAAARPPRRRPPRVRSDGLKTYRDSLSRTYRFMIGLRRTRTSPLFVNEVFSHHGLRSGYHLVSERIGNVLPLGITLLPDRLAGWLTRASAHARKCDLLMLRLALLAGKPRVVHIADGDFKPWWFNPRPRWLDAGLIATFHQPPDVLTNIVKSMKTASLDGAIALARCQMPILEPVVGKDRVWFVPHGVDCAHFRPGTTEPSSKLLICVGVHRRDFVTLQNAARAIRDRIPDAVIRVYGPGAHLPSELHRDPCLDVHGDASDQELLSAYQSAYALLLPLDASTANNVVLEAMACGVPGIISDIEGVRDYVDGECAILCAPGDADAHARAAVRLMTNTSLRNTMSKAARVRAEQFDWPIVQRSLLNVFETMS